jgi:hypothetical protein
MSAFTLRVFHPSIDPRKITEELGLPPTTSWQAGGERAESFWQTRLLGNESGRGDVNSALRDIAARFEHYRFFVDEMREGGGRVEIVIAEPDAPLEPATEQRFRGMNIALVGLSSGRVTLY